MIHAYQIDWNADAMPTIKSDSWEGVYAGLGFAHAWNHPNLTLIALLRAQGRAAEFLGRHSGPGPSSITKQPDGVDYLQSDRLAWQLDIARLGEQYWQQQDESMRARLLAWCDGVNECLRTHPERFDERLRGVGPVTVQMLMAHVAHILLGFQIMLRQPTLVAWMQGAQPVAPSWQSFVGAGSNACVVGPSKSLEGHPMLVCNPHTQWDVDLNTFMECRLEVGQNFAMQGAGMVGWPGLMMGCNAHTGFAATVNTQSSLTFYQLTLQGDRFEVDTEPHLMQQVRRELR